MTWCGVTLCDVQRDPVRRAACEVPRCDVTWRGHDGAHKGQFSARRAGMSATSTKCTAERAEQ